MPAMAARGWADVNNAISGDSVSLGAETYLFDTTGTCAPSGTTFCVAIAAAATGTQKATALMNAVDTRDPTVANPTVTLIADNFNGPEGLAMDSNGDLLITDPPVNTVYRLSPSTTVGTCF